MVLLFESLAIDISPAMSRALAHHLTAVLIVLVTCAATHLLTAFFSYLLEAYPNVVKCQNLLYSTPLRCSNLNRHLGAKIHHVLHRYVM